MLVDISPLPLPPAFTVMIFLQIYFQLPIWPVIIIGVAGSILGRYILTLYIPGVSGRIFKQSKNEDVQFLGDKNEKQVMEKPAFCPVLYADAIAFYTSIHSSRYGEDEALLYYSCVCYW
jgi:hypothetical protein